jgi:hypothetical protein
MILAVERGNELRAWAVELDPKPTAIQPPIALANETAQITALTFDRPLAELGLPPGPLAEAPMPNRLLRSLEFDTFRADVAFGTVVGEWNAIEAPSEAVLDLRVPLGPDALDCPAFDQIVLTRHPRAPGNFLIDLEDGGALAGYGDTIVRFAADGSMIETAQLELIRSATRTSTSIFVVAGDRLFRASLDPLAFAPIAVVPIEVGNTNWISAGPRDEIFSFSSGAEFGFFSNGAWRAIANLPREGSDVSSGGALWLGPGEGAAINSGDSEIARWDGTLHYDIVHTDVLGFGAAAITAFGAIAVETVFGQLFRHEGGGVWIDLGIGQLPRNVQALTEYRDGIAWGSAAGLVGHATEAGDCGGEPVSDASEVLELTRLGDGLLVGHQDRNNDYLLIYFRPRQK